MSKRLSILTSFVLVLALGGVATAEWLDVNNPSFEWMADGNYVTCHAGIGTSPDEDVLGWDSNWSSGSTTWAGVDVNCGAEGMCEDCRDWHRFPDGPVVCFIDDRVWIYQTLDETITAGKRYDLIFDGMIWAGAAHDIIRTDFYYPKPGDANVDPCQVVLSVQDNVVVCEDTPEGLTDWVYDIKHTFVAEAGKPYVGKKLGIKITSPTGGSYIWVDNVRVWSQWASQAYNPKPANAATDVSKIAVLKWSPGVYAKKTKGHDVYFGNTWADVNSATTATAVIFKGNQDANNYDPNGAGPMVLGRTHYWRIDEVNAGYVPGPVPYPPDGKWKGEIWGFTVEGLARNPHPTDGANDVPKNVILRWMSGAEAKYHDVYFGTGESAVLAATTATSGIYKTRINRTTEEWQEYDPVAANPQVGNWYYWRIDEVNTMTVKGYVWGFKVANWILVDDFDFYKADTAIQAKWKPVSTITAYILLNKEPNFAVDGNSMQFEYKNTKSPYRAEAKRTYSPVQDWSYTGNSVTCLELNFFGYADNVNVPAKRVLDPPMYVKLSDGTKTAQVNYTDSNDFIEEWQHTWNIPLKNFSDKGVTLSKISNIILGMGGGEKQAGTIYFDDITLRPPRCFTQYGPAGDFTGDCKVNIDDLAIVVDEWCKSGGWFNAKMPAKAPLVEYKYGEGSGTTVANTGSLGSTYNLTIHKGVDPNQLLIPLHPVVTDPNNNPVWMSDTDPCRGWTLWFDGRDGSYKNYDKKQDALTGGGGDYLLGMTPLNLNSNTVTLATWLKPDPWNMGKGVYEQSGGFTGLIHHRHPTISVGGLSYNFTGGYTYNGELGYEWNGKSATWGFHSGILIPDWQWSLAAVVVEPEQATLYLVDTNNTADHNDDTMTTVTHVYTQAADEWDSIYAIACDGGIVDGGWTDRFFRGQLDSTRVYNYSLTPGEVLGLGEMKGKVFVPLASDVDLCVGIKKPTDPNAPVDDQIDLCDFSKFADEWLTDKLWPLP